MVALKHCLFQHGPEKQSHLVRAVISKVINLSSIEIFCTKNFSEIGELPHSYNLLRYSIKEVFILIEQMACTLITAFWAILAEILHRFV
jgi:hypothetical protein